LNVCQNSRRWI